MSLLRCILPVVFLAVAVRAEAASFRVREAWSNYWGGTESVFHLESADRAAIRWRLSIGGQTLLQGASRVAADGMHEVAIAWPPVKPGVVLEARLDFSRADEGVTRTVYLFNDEPFAGRREWLADLRMVLYDPPGTTADLFDAAEFPYTRISNLAALEGHDGVILIGEGVVLEEEPGLADSVWKAAARGARVLCLAPASGVFALPGPRDAELPQPRCLAFRGSEAITALDKRLDAYAWPPDGVLASRHFTLASDRQRVVAEVTGPETGWLWIEASYSGGGRVVWCAFDLVRCWTSGPTPRELFDRLLTSLTNNKKEH